MSGEITLTAAQSQTALEMADDALQAALSQAIAAKCRAIKTPDLDIGLIHGFDPGGQTTDGEIDDCYQRFARAAHLFVACGGGKEVCGDGSRIWFDNRVSQSVYERVYGAGVL